MNKALELANGCDATRALTIVVAATLKSMTDVVGARAGTYQEASQLPYRIQHTRYKIQNARQKIQGLKLKAKNRAFRPPLVFSQYQD